MVIKKHKNLSKTAFTKKLKGFTKTQKTRAMKAWTDGLECASFRQLSKLLPFVFSVPMMFFTIYAIIRLLANKHFENTVMILPTISIVYNSWRVYQINKGYNI